MKGLIHSVYFDSADYNLSWRSQRHETCLRTAKLSARKPFWTGEVEGERGREGERGGRREKEGEEVRRGEIGRAHV